MTKSKILRYTLIVFILGISLADVVGAQETLLQLDEAGVSLAFKTEIRPSAGNATPSGVAYISRNLTDNEKVIHRIIRDQKSGLHFGYDLVIEPEEKTGKYKISIKSLSQEQGKGLRIFDTSNLEKGKTHIIDTNKPSPLEKTIQPLSKYPAPVIVEAGDTIELNILENPKSLEKLIDIIKIVSKSELTTTTKLVENFDDEWWGADKKPAQDFTPEAIKLKLSNCKFFVNNKQIGNFNGAVAGSIPYIYFQGKGIYVFSLLPRKGYDFKKIGRVENNRMSFEMGGNSYKVISGSPIIEMGGNWNLWVLHDSEYKPQVVESSSYMVGTIDRLETLSKKN